MLKGQWSNMVWPKNNEANFDPDTGVDEAQLKTIGRASVTIPDGFVRFLVLLRSLFPTQCDIIEPSFPSATPRQTQTAEFRVWQEH